MTLEEDPDHTEDVIWELTTLIAAKFQDNCHQLSTA